MALTTRLSASTGLTKKKLAYISVGLLVCSFALSLLLVMALPPQNPESADLSTGRDQFCSTCKNAAGGADTTVKVCTRCSNSPTTNIGFALLGPACALVVVIILVIVFVVLQKRKEKHGMTTAYSQGVRDGFYTSRKLAPAPMSVSEFQTLLPKAASDVADMPLSSTAVST